MPHWKLHALEELQKGDGSRRRHKILENIYLRGRRHGGPHPSEKILRPRTALMFGDDRENPERTTLGLGRATLSNLHRILSTVRLVVEKVSRPL